MIDIFDINITENFKEREFICKCADSKCEGKKAFADIKLVLMLEMLRSFVNKPITITSGYRCKSHNEKVGGAKDSLHMQGKAVDFVISGMKPYEYFYLVEKIFKNGGIGYYNGFVHVDSGKIRRWNG